MESIIKLYGWMDMDIDSIGWDIKVGHLEMHKGRDGELYCWYLDGDGHCGAVSLDTHRIVTDEAEIESLFC